MDELKARIRAEGEYLGDGILKVDAILNHQIDPGLMQRIGQEFARRFSGVQVDRILTAEVSGIGPALMTGLAMNVPIVYARKSKPLTMSGPVYLEVAPSPTKGGEVLLLVSAEFLHKGEHVLVLDDFLASGKTIQKLVQMVHSAHCELAGIGAVIEKSFTSGRAVLEQLGVPVEALVSICEMDEGGEICFTDEQ
ncbi:MAG: xanthine phosphoribosyltransferase [Anaerolineae bacterium]|nr:xanthine phosphoribosyltransferase [Anaerolineae bacterium]